MSRIHRLLSALLRGLVISAVLGSDWTRSSLHGRSADAANVATTGKPWSSAGDSCALPPCPSQPLEVVFSGKPRNALPMGAWMQRESFASPRFLHIAEEGRDGCALQGSPSAVCTTDLAQSPRNAPEDPRNALCLHRMIDACRCLPSATEPNPSWGSPSTTCAHYYSIVLL